MKDLMQRLFSRKPKTPPVERYIVRSAGRHRGEWAFIYIDEEKGVLSAYSSFGTYAYCWSHIGTDTLKEFLRGCDFDYFMKKTVGGEFEVFDFNDTIEGMKEYVARTRREGALTKDQARDAWEEIERLEDKQSVDAFVYDVYASSEICEAYGHDFEGVCRERPNPQCTGFWTIIWPEFLKQISPAKAAWPAPDQTPLRRR